MSTAPTAKRRARTPLLAIWGLAAIWAACGAPSATPGAVDTRNDTCSHCRMTVSDARFAAQLIAPGEEPRFFDDIGCMREYLKATTSLPAGSVAFVASYRTKGWIRAVTAVYLKNDAIETPMGSHIVAFEDAAARDADPASRAGEHLDAAGVFGARLPGGGER